MELKGDSLQIVVLIRRVWSEEMVCLQNRAGEGWLCKEGGSLALLENPPKITFPKFLLCFLIDLIPSQ
jgi:hypothetical protein